jgi:hypothetical protein
MTVNDKLGRIIVRERFMECVGPWLTPDGVMGHPPCIHAVRG